MTPKKIVLCSHDQGKRLLSDQVNSSALIMSYDSSDGYFYHSDVACYGWLYKLKITGFKEPTKKPKGAKDDGLPELPIFFDKLKGSVLTRIEN